MSAPRQMTSQHWKVSATSCEWW